MKLSQTADALLAMRSIPVDSLLSTSMSPTNMSDMPMSSSMIKSHSVSTSNSTTSSANTSPLMKPCSLAHQRKCSPTRFMTLLAPANIGKGSLLGGEEVATTLASLSLSKFSTLNPAAAAAAADHSWADRYADVVRAQAWLRSVYELEQHRAHVVVQQAAAAATPTAAGMDKKKAVTFVKASSSLRGAKFSYSGVHKIKKLKQQRGTSLGPLRLPPALPKLALGKKISSTARGTAGGGGGISGYNMEEVVAKKA